MDGSGLLGGGGGGEGSSSAEPVSAKSAAVAGGGGAAAGGRDAELVQKAVSSRATNFLTGGCEYLCCGLLCKMGRVKGDHWDVPIPRSPEELTELGPAWV